ncbi:hypothetical protein KKC1_24010 [Calderihabitans maritimus]|uniref:Uncharacterized protein n=1 Tax=Calderihabitans maritimus TaxID=1246530 RepID=A0A1Z5HUS3_9FIRM|nr:hypothetical protein KKC1_24010 [Calderihabitans maritimus]
MLEEDGKFLGRVGRGIFIGGKCMVMKH